MSEEEFRDSCPGEDYSQCRERGLRFLQEVSSTIITPNEGLKRRLD